MLTNLLTALHFLTPVRTKRELPFDAPACRRSAIFFPLIGLLIGGLVWGADCLLRPVLPTTLLSIVLVGLLAVLSRGVHLDGVVKSADALFGGSGSTRKGSGRGPFGVLVPCFYPGVQSPCLGAVTRRLSRHRSLARPYAGAVGVRGDGL